MPSLNVGTVKVPLLVEIELVPVVTVPPLKSTDVVAVEAFPVQDPEDPLTFPVTLPVKLALTVVALIVPPDDDEVPLLKLVAVVAVAAFPVQDPEDPLTFPVTLPVKDPENVADTVPETVSFPVMANVPPDGIILLMVEDKETGDPTVDPQGLILVDVLSPVNISSELLDIYVNVENFRLI